MRQAGDDGGHPTASTTHAAVGLGTLREVPLSQIRFEDIPHEDDQHPDWRIEHEQEYATFGGAPGYVEHLTNDLREHGQREAVELNDRGDHYTVRDGNHRLNAARRAGLPCVQALVY